MRLFIAEKPTLAKAIANGLGKNVNNDGYIKIAGTDDIVTWCFGHILEQSTPEEYDDKYKVWKIEDLPIVPEIWKLKVSKSCVKQFKIVKDLISKADEIVNGGDPDREGQLLVDEVLEFVKNRKPVKRILLNALDDISVKRAINNLRDNRDFAGLHKSALARSRADWLVGMNLSRAYSIQAKKAGFDNVSVGRVQTPTMALVVRRELEIKNFIPVNYYQAEIIWQHKNGMVKSLWQPDESTSGLDNEYRIIDKKIIKNLLGKIQSSHTGIIDKIEQNKRIEAPRLPYSLSALQIDAGKKYGYTPKQVLVAMQSLYEKKYTTYPRSDCDYLPVSQFTEADQIINNLKNISSENISKFAYNADSSLQSRAWNDKKISAHHAIIPTRVEADFSSFSEIEKNLYMLTAKAYIAQFYPEHIYMATKIYISCENEKFTSTGKTILKMGWKSLYTADKKESSEKEDEINELPIMQNGDNVIFSNGRGNEKITKPPCRFNPSTLLKAMKEISKYVKDSSLKAVLKECSGIGTEATRASIIDKLQEKDYLKSEKKYLVPSEKAYMVCKVLPEDVLYPDVTAMWEKSLDEVKENNMNLEDFLSQQVNFINTLISLSQNSHIEPSINIVKCPSCGRAMKRRKGKKGFFWGCTGYPDCDNTIPDKSGKPDFTEKTISKISCPNCGKNLRRMNGKFGPFWGCSGYPDCKTNFNDKNGHPLIPLLK